jgi:UPF0755 protein
LSPRVALAALAVLASLAATGVGVVLHAVYSRPSVGDGRPVLFTVETGESFSSAAARLGDLGLLGNPQAVEIYAWVRGWDRRVKAGTYQLYQGDRARDILGKLVVGDVLKVAVTIPEGFTDMQIAGVLGAVAHVDSAAFAALLTDRRVLDELDVKGPSLEGYLFPDTYLIPWGMTPREIVGMMRARLEEVFDEGMNQRLEEIGMTRHDVLTLASIVQAETRLSEEMPLVSAVYHNRRKSGMKLEADPTVAYAMGGYKGRLYYKDLEVDSPYNTYIHNGLPPGPICAPGKAAIVSALYPDTMCKAVYFVAKGDGGHIFSLTLKDHLGAVEAVRRAKAESN